MVGQVILTSEIKWLIFRMCFVRKRRTLSLWLHSNDDDDRRKLEFTVALVQRGPVGDC